MTTGRPVDATPSPQPPSSQPPSPQSAADPTAAGPVPPDPAVRRGAAGRMPAWAWDVVVDAGVAVVGTLPSGHEPRWAYPAAVLGGVALLARRRLPVLVLLASFPALIGGLGTMAAGAALYAFGKVRPRTRVVLPWLLLTVVVTMAPVVWTYRQTGFGPRAWGDWVVTVLVVLLVTAGPAAAGALTAIRAQLAASLATLRAAEADRDAAVTAKARAEERNRIAREVHDIVGHYAALIAVQAGALEARAPDGPTRETAVRLRELSSGALEEMRTAVALWRRAGDGPADSREWVSWVLQPAVVARESGVRLTVTRADGLPGAVSEAVLRVLRRAVQEGVANAVRHGPGAPVTVDLAGAAGTVGVTVRNPAPSAEPREGGNGLTGLRERVRRLGGSVEAGRAGGEWVLAVTVPPGTGPVDAEAVAAGS
ncbi:MAG TPA: histidine kinase [Pseudonocardiaceae bacterium]